MTINQVLVLMKEVRGRANDLKGLRSLTATKTRSYFGERETKEIEPQYDVKSLDRKIVSLENWLFQADSAIKQLNASTEVTGLETDVEKLLEPLM